MNNSPLVALLFGSGLSGAGYRFEQHDAASRAAMVSRILATKGAAVTEQPSVTLVAHEAQNTIYLITQAGHFAHPSILKRALVAANGARHVDVSGFTAGAAEPMATWMAQFEEQDAQMRRI